MDKNHYKPLIWNDSSSLLLYDHWLQELDDDKIYFTKKDISLFQQYRNNSAEIRSNGQDLFSLSVTLYRKRLREADSSINSYLSKPIDFTKPDRFRWPADDFASDVKELELRRQHYLKWSVLDNIADELTSDKKPLPETVPTGFAKSEADERLRIQKRETAMFRLLLQSPEEFRGDMEDEFLNAIAWCYDPHSTYMNFREKEQFEAEVSAEEFTAGFTLEENEKGERLIDHLQPGGSAWRSGQVHKGDVLLKIAIDKKEYNAADLSDSQISSLLGSSGNMIMTVKTIAGEIKTVKLAQEKITDEESTVKSYLVKSTKTFGYIDLPGFYSRETDGKKLTYEGCAKDLSRELIKLRKDSISGLIIDLRNNGGGSMWEAIQLSGIFIDAGPVASAKDREGKSIFLKDPNRGTLYDGPMVILVNGRSASASEFFAAAMQDYNRAIIVGGSTYGKGTAQSIKPLDTLPGGSVKDYADFVKVTGDKFYRVNGSTVQWQGVVPDIILPDIYSGFEFKERTHASALVPDQGKAGYYQPLPALPIASLQQQSAARIKDNSYFKSINELISKINEREKGTDIPLQWRSFAEFYQKQNGDLNQEITDQSAKIAITAANNGFDSERQVGAEEAATEANKNFLHSISQSSEIAEACRILEDYIKLKQ